MLEKRNAKWVVLLCSVTYFICYLTRKNYGSIISVLEAEKGILVSVALTANAVSYGLGQLISGYMGDKVKPINLVFYGLITTVLMNLLLPFCPNIPLMTVVWCINGLAQAFMWPPMVKYLTDLLTSEQYSSACVRVSWGGYIGDIAVYLLSPVCISLWRWEGVFFIAGGLGLIMAIIWRIAAPTFEKKKIGTKEIKENNQESGKKLTLNWTAAFIILIGFTMLAIALQGILRDGITTWMPEYMKNTYGWDDAQSILSGVVLPLFSIGTLQLVSWIYIKKVKNEHNYAAVLFGIGCVAALLLYFMTGANPAVSIALCAIISACMHGVNYVLICMIPKHFEKFGKVSFMSGLLNACTYIGTAVAGYGMALVSELKGWNFTILMWSVVAGAGCIICLLMSKKWGSFLKEK